MLEQLGSAEGPAFGFAKLFLKSQILAALDDALSSHFTGNLENVVLLLGLLGCDDIQILNGLVITFSPVLRPADPLESVPLHRCNDLIRI